MTLVMDRKPRTQILEDAGIDGDYQGYDEYFVREVLKAADPVFSVYEALRNLASAKGYRTAEYTAAAVLAEIGAPRFQRTIEHD